MRYRNLDDDGPTITPVPGQVTPGLEGLAQLLSAPIPRAQPVAAPEPVPVKPRGKRTTKSKTNKRGRRT